MAMDELDALLQSVQRENKLEKMKQGTGRLDSGKCWLVRGARGGGRGRRGLRAGGKAAGCNEIQSRGKVRRVKGNCQKINDG